MLEEIFDLRITLKFRNKLVAKIHNVMFSKWLVDEDIGELAKNSSLQFEIISKFLSSI